MRFVLLVLPTKELVYLEHMATTHGTIPDEFVTYDAKERELENETRAFCAAEHIECVFPLAALAHSLDRQIQIYDRTVDGHPIEAGNRAIAETLDSYLRTTADGQ